MPPFMMEIDAARRSPLDQLAVDYFAIRSGLPSLDLCRRVHGVLEDDVMIARRLSVAVSSVRGWREVGRKATSRWACR
jgi:hypothetical protein